MRCPMLCAYDTIAYCIAMHTHAGIIAATGVTFRTLEESVRDCVESLMGIGGVEPERTDEWKVAQKARL